MPRSFTLVRTLGRGAHGAVHLAEMRDEDDYVQTLAIKRLLPEWSTDPDLVARLKDEARLLARLQHEHVVRVHGLTRIDGTLAILMEPVDGVDLGKVIARNGALAPRVSLEIVRAIAEALDAAWTTAPPGHGPLRVVHRDIKPSNVMLTPRGAVKVMDFGVARADLENREGETRSQQFGTARYMAPERWIDGRADHASDVFSLGITLIEIASGSPVPRFRLSTDGFRDDQRDALQTLKWEPMRELAARMLAFASIDRPTAAEVAVDCNALLRDAPGPDLRTWAADAVVVAEGEPVDPTIAATVVREDSASRAAATIKPDNRGWYAFLGISLALGLCVVWATSPTQPPKPPPAPVAAPTPDPVPDPEPALVAPIPQKIEPQPAPPDPVPAPPPPKPHPVPAPVPEPQPAPVPTVPWSFHVPDGAKVDAGTLGSVTRPHQDLNLPRGQVLTITVILKDGTRIPCTIYTGGAGNLTVDKDGTCQSSSS